MPTKDKPNTLKICSWNGNGIRAIEKKGFHDWIKKEEPDILCLQETKAQSEQLDDSLRKMEKYSAFFCSAERKGYSGVATYSKTEPINVRMGFGQPLYDLEGRVIETEYEKFTLFNVYFP